MNVRIKLFIECPMEGKSNGIVTHGEEEGGRERGRRGLKWEIKLN